MDFGFGNLIEKLEQYFGKPITMILLGMLILFALIWLIQGIYEGALWIYAIIGEEGEELGLVTVRDWYQLAGVIITCILALLALNISLIVWWQIPQVRSVKKDLEEFKREVVQDVNDIRTAISEASPEAQDEFDYQYKKLMVSRKDKGQKSEP